MKREDLAKKLAQETRRSTAKARDEVDALVYRILKSLKAGKPVELPGVGRLISAKRAPRDR